MPIVTRQAEPRTETGSRKASAFILGNQSPPSRRSCSTDTVLSHLHTISQVVRMASLPKSQKRRVVTRSDSEHFLLGQPRDIEENVLPSRKNYINCVRRMSSQVDPTSGRQMTVQKAVVLVCNRVLDIWAREGIPTITQRRAVQLGQVCHRRYAKLTVS